MKSLTQGLGYGVVEAVKNFFVGGFLGEKNSPIKDGVDEVKRNPNKFASLVGACMMALVVGTASFGVDNAHALTGGDLVACAVGGAAANRLAQNNHRNNHRDRESIATAVGCVGAVQINQSANQRDDIRRQQQYERQMMAQQRAQDRAYQQMIKREEAQIRLEEKRLKLEQQRARSGYGAVSYSNAPVYQKPVYQAPVFRGVVMQGNNPYEQSSSQVPMTTEIRVDYLSRQMAGDVNGTRLPNAKERQALETHRDSLYAKINKYDSLNEDYNLNLSRGQVHSSKELNNSFNQALSGMETLVRTAENLARAGVNVTAVQGIDESLMRVISERTAGKATLIQRSNGETISAPEVKKAADTITYNSRAHGL